MDLCFYLYALNLHGSMLLDRIIVQPALSNNAVKCLLHFVVLRNVLIGIYRNNQLRNQFNRDIILICNISDRLDRLIIKSRSFIIIPWKLLPLTLW